MGCLELSPFYIKVIFILVTKLKKNYYFKIFPNNQAAVSKWQSAWDVGDQASQVDQAHL